MRIVFRVDASVQIGTGHIMRCWALAAELRHRGIEVIFICREHPGNLIGSLRADGYVVRQLPFSAPANSQHDPGYASWLGADQSDDARATKTVIGDEVVDWLVVDHYALSAHWHQALRPSSRRIMVIDDLAERPLDCDLLLNQNLAQHEKAQQYQSLISKACETLFGPRYALLSSNFRMLHESVQPHSGHVRRALIAMGGSDPGNSTALVVEAMSASQFQHIELDVIVGVNFAHREQIAELLSRRGNANLRGPLPSLVVAMAAADIAIGAGGTMSWERMCLGLPTIVISIAENQVSGCRALDSARVAIYAGSIDELTTPALITVLQTVLTDSALLREMSQRGLSIVDGQGASRVADRLTERA